PWPGQVGRKVKCPNCGRAVRVPALPGSRTAGGPPLPQPGSPRDQQVIESGLIDGPAKQPVRGFTLLVPDGEATAAALQTSAGELQPPAAPASRLPVWRRTPVLLTALVLVLGLGAAAWLLAPSVFRVETPPGTPVVQSEPDRAKTTPTGHAEPA